VKDWFVPVGTGAVIDGSSYATWWLIFILVAVIVAASLVLGCCLFCYRSEDAQKLTIEKVLSNLKKMFLDVEYCRMDNFHSAVFSDLCFPVKWNFYL